MMSTTESFPQLWNQGLIEPVGARKQLQGVASKLESYTTQTQDFAPTYSEVVNLTGFAENKGLNV